MRRTVAWFLLGIFILPLSACQKEADPPRPVGSAAPALTDDPGREEERSAVPAVEDVIPRTTFTRIAKTLSPAVVHLKTLQKTPEAWNPFHRKSGERFWGGWIQRLLGRSKEIVLRQEGIGSGFLVHPAGYLLTNDHVVNHAAEIHAVLSDGRELPARVVGRESRSDLALLQIEAEGPFPSADLGDSDQLESGEWALAVGSPLGLSQTFTVGVISATGRTHLGIASRENFIQTDASINYGNSGGPLVNIRGEVIGINTAIMPTGHGIGFAIPINMARRFAEAVLSRHPIETAWLGLQIGAAASGPRGRHGVTVLSVQWGSPAWRAGLRSADRLVRMNGKELPDTAGLRRLIADGGVGAEWILTVEREGVARDYKVGSEVKPMRVFP